MKFLFLLSTVVSAAVSAAPFSPISISDRAINGRTDLKRQMQRQTFDLKDTRWDMIEYSDADIQVRLERKVISLMLDLQIAARGQVRRDQGGSEQLFNQLDPLNPPFKNMKKLATVMNVVVGAHLLMPHGPEFFVTQTGVQLRQIFAKLRTSPTAPLNVAALSTSEKETLIIYLGGILWRMRGGGVLDLPKGTQDTRKYYVEYAFQGLGEIVGKNLSSIASSHKWALIMKGWGKFFDMGMTPGQSDIVHDLINMTDRGYYQIQGTLASIRSYKGKPDNAVVSGYTMGPCYFISHHEFINDHEGPNLGFPLHPLFHGHTSWGEVCAGAHIALGIFRSLN